MQEPAFFSWRPHPWHGLEVGQAPPVWVCAFIEMTPFDLVKYELDKSTGYLKVDRPQRASSCLPTLYGFIPRTYCGRRVGALSGLAEGDRDPLDICVISERPINKSEILLNARIVGGIQLIDHDEADDKIIGILAKDPVWGEASDLSELPSSLIERLSHYFSTYKMVPGQKNQTSIKSTYPASKAHQVVQAAIEDYQEKYPPSAF
jgi:inorganic pyrophosphatase